MPNPPVTINVKSHGAKGDNRTDDTAALTVSCLLYAIDEAVPACFDTSSLYSSLPVGVHMPWPASMPTSLHTVQAAIKAATDNPAGGVVYLPAGVYILRQPVVIKTAKVVIRGDGVSLSTSLAGSHTQLASSTHAYGAFFLSFVPSFNDPCKGRQLLR
jgi:hypothetical protein